MKGILEQISKNERTNVVLLLSSSDGVIEVTAATASGAVHVLDKHFSFFQIQERVKFIEERRNTRYQKWSPRHGIVSKMPYCSDF